MLYQPSRIALTRKTIRARRKLLLIILAGTIGSLAAFFAAKWMISDRFFVTTDNAFVTGNLIPVYADSTGVVAEVLADETQSVKKGDLLLRLDGQRAAAALAQARGELGRAARGVGALFATRQQICEKIASRIASRDRARHDLARYQQAVSNGSVSQQILQNTRDQLAALEADLREARAEMRAVEAKIGGVSRANHPDIETAQAKFFDAYIESARQQIRAPASGYIAKRKAQVGQRVKPGDQLLTIVPLDHLWVEANIWENRLERIRPGQSAEVIVDLYGKVRTFHGTVEGLIPGSGSVFAVLPPDNATGNFIHIVQRVPVRIALRPDELKEVPLRPGLSTVTAIDVRNTEVSPNASGVKTSFGEYETDIYKSELGAAKSSAVQIIAENLIGQIDGTDSACPNGE